MHSFDDTEFETVKCMHPNVKKEAQFLLKYGTDNKGYQDSDKLMLQVKEAVTIAEIKYTSEKFFCLIRAVDIRLMIVSHVNVKSGGC